MAQQVVEAQLLRQRGDQERDSFRSIQHSASVLLADHVKRMRTDHAAVGGNSNDWARGCHDGCCRTVFSILNNAAGEFSKETPIRPQLGGRNLAVGCDIFLM